MRPVGARKGSADPVVRPTPGHRLSHRLSFWTLPGGPPSCVRRCRGSVRRFSLSNGPILSVWHRMKSFVCFCCVLCLFSPYSTYGCLQTKNHQNSWNWLELSPTTTFGVWLIRKAAGVDSFIFDLRTVNNTPTLSLCSFSSEGERTKVKHNFQRYEASIRDIPNLTLHLWTLKCLSCHLG